MEEVEVETPNGTSKTTRGRVDRTDGGDSLLTEVVPAVDPSPIIDSKA